MTSNSTVAILGGTFDPIHRGHIQPAEQALKQFDISRVKVMPLGVAVHRDQPIASHSQRLAMCELAINDKPVFELDSREIDRGDASYTYKTLELLREQMGPTQSLCWIIGRDSLDTFTTWDEWQRILKAGHLLVLNRPGYDNDAPVNLELQSYLSQDFVGPSGCIVLCQVPPVDVSSTEIRKVLTKASSLGNDDLEYLQSALDDNVRQYIQDQKLYTHGL